MKPTQPIGMSSHRILDALDGLVESCIGDATPNPITSIYPVSGGGISIHQVVKLNGQRITSTCFSWHEKPDGGSRMMCSKYPKVEGALGVTQDYLPPDCWRDVMLQYSQHARIMWANVAGALLGSTAGRCTIKVVVIDADGKNREDRFEFRPVGFYPWSQGWKLVPYGGA